MPDPATDAAARARPAPGAVEAIPGVASMSPGLGRLFIVVGVFDGLHRGHLYLLRHLRQEAVRRRARPAVITFDAHPDEIVLGTAPPLLCDLDERLALLAGHGVDVTVVQHFDVALRLTPYDVFVEMLRARTEVAGFLMTPDAAFGHERRGTPTAVAELGRRDGFDVVILPPLELDGRAVRSADIRAAVAAGDLADARHLLGRSLAVVGTRIASTGAAGMMGAAPAGAGERQGERRAEVVFPMPVALPPAGRYVVRVEPAWRPESAPRPARERHVVEARADVDGRSVRLAARRPLPQADRLRIAFVRRAGST